MSIKFITVEDKDVVYLDDFCLCTIDYDGDFSIESVREEFRKRLTKAFKTKNEVCR